MDKVEALWSEFEARTVVRVVVKHCTHLEMPPTLQKRYNLNGMKFYNSSIANWGQDTALTNTFHPKIMRRISPHLLTDLEFCVTNLETLPDDLNLRWPKYATVYLEMGTMAVVPDVLARLAPFYLSFAGSPIEELPAALFEANGIDYLRVGGTKISNLPRNVTHMGGSLNRLILQDTNVSFYWFWLDEMFAYSTISRVYAEASPFCELQNQFLQSSEEGIVMSIDAAAQGVPLSRLMNFSDSNRAFLLERVSRKKTATMVYPLAFEDTYSGLKTTGDG